MTATKHNERGSRQVSSPYRYVFPFLTVFYILSLTIINLQVYYVLDTTHQITTILKTPQMTVVRGLEMCLEPPGKFFFPFYLDTNMNFLLLTGLRQTLQPTPPTTPT